MAKMVSGCIILTSFCWLSTDLMGFCYSIDLTFRSGHLCGWIPRGKRRIHRFSACCRLTRRVLQWPSRQHAPRSSFRRHRLLLPLCARSLRSARTQHATFAAHDGTERSLQGPVSYVYTGCLRVRVAGAHGTVRHHSRAVGPRKSLLQPCFCCLDGIHLGTLLV